MNVLMLFRKLNNEDVRVVCVTETGTTIFDLEFPSGKPVVENYVFKKFKKRRVLNVFKMALHSLTSSPQLASSNNSNAKDTIDVRGLSGVTNRYITDSLGSKVIKSDILRKTTLWQESIRYGSDSGQCDSITVEFKRLGVYMRLLPVSI